MKKLPEYDYQAICPECLEVCAVIALQNDFDYSGSHCSHGLPGTHYPQDWGSPVSACCEADISEEDIIDG